MLRILSMAQYWHADGTFRSAAKHFMQLYLIHASFGKWTFPCAFIFMKRRREHDYVQALLELKAAAGRHGFVLDPWQVIVDFETGAIAAFLKIFGRIRVKVSFFLNNTLILKHSF